MYGQAGAIAVRRVKPEDMKRIAKATGGQVRVCVRVCVLCGCVCVCVCRLLRSTRATNYKQKTIEMSVRLCDVWRGP